MDDYQLTKGEYRGAKSRLTRAQKTNNPETILKVAKKCLALFEEKGYPDDWSNWQRAADDASFAMQRGGGFWR